MFFDSMDHVQVNESNCPPLPSTALAASYARSATPTGDGLHQQHKANFESAAAEGWHIPEGPAFRFGEDATGGTTMLRPGLQALLGLIRAGHAEFDRLYIQDRERIVRAFDMQTVWQFEEELRSFGVLVVYARDKSCPPIIDRAALEFQSSRLASESSKSEGQP